MSWRVLECLVRQLEDLLNTVTGLLIELKSTCEQSLQILISEWMFLVNVPCFFFWPVALCDMHPMRALFLIPRNPPPRLKSKKWWVCCISVEHQFMLHSVQYQVSTTVLRLIMIVSECQWVKHTVLINITAWFRKGLGSYHGMIIFKLHIPACSWDWDAYGRGSHEPILRATLFNTGVCCIRCSTAVVGC